MYGVFYAIAKIFGFVKDAVVDDITDVQDRQNNKINEIAYVGKGGLRSYQTGHQLSFVNSHIYKDNKTFKIIKVPLSDEDIRKEKENKEKAIQNGYEVYECSDYYLPDNTVGFVYKSIDDDRLYVLRYIKNTLTNNAHRIDGLYYVSIMPDNFGHVERSWKGRLIDEKESFLKDYFFRLDNNFWKDDKYIWKVRI